MSIRGCVFTLVLLALSFAISAPTRADVRSIDPAQTLPRQPGYAAWGTDLAIDGGYIIVMAFTEGSQSALLYRRSASNGQWVYRRVLWTYSGPYVRFDVAMRNGIAAVQFGDEIRLFEQSSGDYVRASSTAPIRHQGGVAISGTRVIIGGNDCDYDAVIYEKNAAGSWAITGRIDDNQGECLASFDLAMVDISADYAVTHFKYAREAHVWRRNGTALDWVRAGTLTFAPDEPVGDDKFAMQGATVVGPNGIVWLRTGTSTWTRQGVLTSVDREDGTGSIFNVTYRNGALISTESEHYGWVPHVYIEASPGHFEHVASLQSYPPAIHNYDVSNGTVVATVSDPYGTPATFEVHVFTLPAQMRVPAPVVNNFEDRDASDFTFTGGQFALAARGSDDVLAQSATGGLAIATVNDTDWTYYQRVEADVTTSFGGTGSWVGLVARYVDANNYYYAVVRANKTYGIYKRVNGVDTTLLERAYTTIAPTFRATLWVRGNEITVDFGVNQGSTPDTVTDNSLAHGRAGVATFMSRADFDDVNVAAADNYSLFSRYWGFGGSDFESDLDELSGRWQVLEISDDEESALVGLAQLDTSGDARAVIGVPVANQDIYANMRVDSFGAGTQGSWFGLIARYVDANNFYYVTIRSTGQIQIRRVVNGVISVLATRNFTAVLGQYYDVRFQVIGDQLQLYVEGSLVATAHDRRIASGRYGLATYRAQANWASLSVFQP